MISRRCISAALFAIIILPIVYGLVGEMHKFGMRSYRAPGINRVFMHGMPPRSALNSARDDNKTEMRSLIKEVQTQLLLDMVGVVSNDIASLPHPEVFTDLGFEELTLSVPRSVITDMVAARDQYPILKEPDKLQVITDDALDTISDCDMLIRCQKSASDELMCMFGENGTLVGNISLLVIVKDTSSGDNHDASAMTTVATTMLHNVTIVRRPYSAEHMNPTSFREGSGLSPRGRTSAGWINSSAANVSNASDVPAVLAKVAVRALVRYCAPPMLVQYVPHRLPQLFGHKVLDSSLLNPQLQDVLQLILTGHHHLPPH